MVDLLSEKELRSSIELMYFAYRGFTSHADKTLEQKGLGRLHHRVLYFIGRNHGLTISELLKILAISKQALNAPLRQLIEMKLVEVVADNNDRRLKRLQLSEEGNHLEKILTGKQMRQIADAFKNVENSDIAAWRNIMNYLSNTNS